MVFKALIRANRGKIDEFKDILREAFLRVKNDIDDQRNVLNQQQGNISNLIGWMNFVYNNHKRLEESHRTLTFQHNQHRILSKQDVQNLKQWISHFEMVQGEQKKRESDILNDLEKVKNDLKTVLLYMEESKSESSALRSRLEKVETRKTEVTRLEPPEFKVPATPYVKPEEEHSNVFERKLVQRMRPNRKQYIMKEIQDLISQGKYSTSDIEEIIVNEKNLCGRTSFFGYLKEMKLKGQITYAQLADKQVLVLNEK